MHPLIRLYTRLRWIRYPAAVAIFLAACILLSHPAVYLMGLILLFVVCCLSGPLSKDMFKVKQSDITARVLYTLVPLILTTGYALTCHLSFVYDMNMWADSDDLHIGRLDIIFYVSLIGNIAVTLLNIAVYLEGQYRKLK